MTIARTELDDELPNFVFLTNIAFTDARKAKHSKYRQPQFGLLTHAHATRVPLLP